jgi:mannose-6-phosphate isomerase-like protein (cupin superfamily)
MHFKHVVLGSTLLLSSLASAQDDAAMGKRVQDLLHTHQADVFACVQNATKKPDGEMLVRVMVGEDQHASKADVLKDQSGGGALGACLTDKIRKWDLKPLSAATGDQVVFPLVFKPEELKPGQKRVVVPMAAQETQGAQRFLVDDQSIGEAPLASMSMLSLGANQTAPAGKDHAQEELAIYILDGSFKSGTDTIKKGDVLWLGEDTPRPALAPLDKKPLKLLEIRAHGTGKGQKLVHAEDAKSYPLPGGGGTATLMLDGTGAKLAVDVLKTEAGSSVAPHKHANTDEVLFIVAGSGSGTVGKQSYELATGDAVRIAANAMHSMKSVEPLEAIQVYAPNGPEQRFKPGGGETGGKKKKSRK